MADLPIGFAGGEQLVVSPCPGQYPVVEHQDPVGVFDGADPLGNEEHRHPLRPGDGTAESGVGRIVQRTGGIIQNQDLRAADKGPGDG